MALGARAKYRAWLTDKFLGMDEEGYGDFQYEDSQLNHFLELAILGLFPALFKLDVKVAALPSDGLFLTVPNVITMTRYGNNNLGYIIYPEADRTYAIEDASTLDELIGWQAQNGRIKNIDTIEHTAVNVHYYSPIIPTSNDVDDDGIPPEFGPLIVLGATIEALESRHDTGLKGQGEPLYRYTGVHEETTLIDRLRQRYKEMKDAIAMSLPTVNF